MLKFAQSITLNNVSENQRGCISILTTETKLVPVRGCLSFRKKVWSKLAADEEIYLFTTFFSSV